MKPLVAGARSSDVVVVTLAERRAMMEDMDMRNFSMIALVAASLGLASFGGTVAASANSGGMGDPSAAMRANQALCDAQRRGEYPSYHNACLPDYPGPYDQSEPRKQ